MRSWAVLSLCVDDGNGWLVLFQLFEASLYSMAEDASPCITRTGGRPLSAEQGNEVQEKERKKERKKERVKKERKRKRKKEKKKRKGKRKKKKEKNWELSN